MKDRGKMKIRTGPRAATVRWSRGFERETNTLIRPDMIKDYLRCPAGIRFPPFNLLLVQLLRHTYWFASISIENKSPLDWRVILVRGIWPPVYDLSGNAGLQLLNCYRCRMDCFHVYSRTCYWTSSAFFKAHASPKIML